MRNEEKPKSILTVDTDITEKNNWKRNSPRTATGNIGTLASGIADLNNVLGPILMVAELLQENISDRVSSCLQNWKSTPNVGLFGQAVLGFARGMKGERTILRQALA